MARPILFAHGTSARERYDGVAANLFEVENERFVAYILSCMKIAPLIQTQYRR